MDIAVMTYSFSRVLESGERDLPGIIRLLGNLNVSRIELMESLMRPEEIPAVRQALAESGINLAMYYLQNLNDNTKCPAGLSGLAVGASSYTQNAVSLGAARAGGCRGGGLRLARS